MWFNRSESKRKQGARSLESVLMEARETDRVSERDTVRLMSCRAYQVFQAKQRRQRAWVVLAHGTIRNQRTLYHGLSFSMQRAAGSATMHTLSHYA